MHTLLLADIKEAEDALKKLLKNGWRQWLPIRAALRRATPLRLDAQYGAADLAVLSSPSMREPGVVGIWRPRLLLPEGIVQRLTPAQLRALIAHQQCHIRIFDALQDQLGLQLRPTSVPIDVLVIDRVEQPSQN